MLILATPKETPYIIKKSEASKIIDSKNTLSDATTIKSRARAFELNNLKGVMRYEQCDGKQTTEKNSI